MTLITIIKTREKPWAQSIAQCANFALDKPRLRLILLKRETIVIMCVPIDMVVMKLTRCLTYLKDACNAVFKPGPKCCDVMVPCLILFVKCDGDLALLVGSGWIEMAFIDVDKV